MLQDCINEMIKNKNYDLSGMKINFIKENNDCYLSNFEERIESVGRPLNYRVNKNNGKIEPLFLPDDANLDFLDSFVNCDFVQIPEKFRGKYF